MEFKEKIDAEGPWIELVNAYRSAAKTYEENPSDVGRALREHSIQAAVTKFKSTELVKKGNGELEKNLEELAKNYHVIIANEDTQKIYDSFYNQELSKLNDPIVDLTFRAAKVVATPADVISPKQEVESYYREIQAQKSRSTSTDHLTLLTEIQPADLSQKLQEKYEKYFNALKFTPPSLQDIQQWVNILKQPPQKFSDYHNELEKAPKGIQLLFNVSPAEYKSAQEAAAPKNTPTLRRGG